MVFQSMAALEVEAVLPLKFPVIHGTACSRTRVMHRPACTASIQQRPQVARCVGCKFCHRLRGRDAGYAPTCGEGSDPMLRFMAALGRCVAALRDSILCASSFGLLALCESHQRLPCVPRVVRRMRSGHACPQAEARTRTGTDAAWNVPLHVGVLVASGSRWLDLARAKRRAQTGDDQPWCGALA